MTTYVRVRCIEVVLPSNTWAVVSSSQVILRIIIDNFKRTARLKKSII